MFQRDASLGIEFFYRLDKDEAKRAEVGAHTRRVGDVEEFHVFVVIDPEVEVFHFIVNLCAYHAVGHIQSEIVVNFQKADSFAETSCLIDVFTIYL